MTATTTSHKHPAPRAARARTFAAILAIALLAWGCRKPADTQVTPPGDSQTTVPETPGQACAATAEWPDERIPMPPDWAPELPAGYELLRFSPGMYKPERDDYFSYVFALMWDRPGALDSEQLSDILDQYYRGLTSAVAAAKKLNVPTDEISVKVTGAIPAFRATVEMWEPFVTGQKITIEMDLAVGVSCLAAKVSPKPRDHAVWQELATAAACLPCP